MRFTSFIAVGVLTVAASAQTTSTVFEVITSTVSSSEPAETTPAVISEIQKCLAACDPTDTNCRADCIAVPTPNEDDVNQTTKCVTECKKGNGTAEDNDAYADCVNGCIGQYFFTPSPNQGTTPTNGGGSSSGISIVPSVTQVPTTIVTDGTTITTSFPSTLGPNPTSSGGNAESTSSMDAGAAVYGPIGGGLTFLGLLAGFIL